jgi:hypothetical protein
MNKKTNKIAEDFTKFPSGRFKTDGNYTGEHFREDILLPSLKANDQVIVDINGVRGYGSSFLEESFGGIVREKYFTENELRDRLIIQCSDANSSYRTEIWQYIKEAQNELG